MTMIDVAKYQQMCDDSTPGKLEGEGPATAYYYEAMLDGDGEMVSFAEAEAWANGPGFIGDGDLPTSTVFKVTDEERTAFNLSEPFYEIWITNDGFIMAGEATQAQYNKATSA